MQNTFVLVNGEVVNFDYSIRLVHAVKLALCDYCNMDEFEE